LRENNSDLGALRKIESIRVKNKTAFKGGETEYRIGNFKSEVKANTKIAAAENKTA